MKNLFALLVLTTLVPSISTACLWVQIDKKTIECRTPYRNFYGADNQEARNKVLKIALTNAQRKITKIFNESDVLALMTESDQLYKDGNVEAVDKAIAVSDEVLKLTNEITASGDQYVRSEEDGGFLSFLQFDKSPSAILVGATLPIKNGIPLTAIQKLLTKFNVPNMKAGAGSVFFAATLVPQVAEYVATYDSENSAHVPADAVLIHTDSKNKVKIYDLSKTKEAKWRWLDIGLSAYPTADLELPRNGKAAKKAGGLQPTIALAWGQNILRPADIGSWGLSYSVPTVLANTPGGMEKTILGRFPITRPFITPLLKGLNLVGVENAKLSFNSSSNLFESLQNWSGNPSTLPLDQFMINVRGGDIRSKNQRKLAPALAGVNAKPRMGINFGMDFFSAMGASDNLWEHVGSIFGLGTLFGMGGDKSSASRVSPEQEAEQLVKAINAKKFTQELSSAISSFDQPASEISEDVLQTVVGDAVTKLLDQNTKD